MKSYLLEGADPQSLAEALTQLLPGQTDPWLLLAPDGDPIAYFRFESGDVQADVSGRHFNEDDTVLAVLSALKERVGGSISGDD